MNDLIKLIPNPDPLPVAGGWFQFLSHLTYYLHLISVGIMFGIAVSMAVGYFKGKSDENWLGFGKEMGHLLPFTIAFTVNLGVAPLLFIQVLYGNFFYTASTLIGLYWILLIVILIFGYYGAYWISFRGKTGSKRGLSLIVTLILAWTGFILVNVNTLMLKPELWKSYFSHMGGLHLNLADTTLIPRYTFYIFLLLGIGGLFIALFSGVKWGEEKGKPWKTYGASLSGYSLLLTLPSYLLYLWLLPGDIRGQILSGNLFWTLLNFLAFTGLLAAGILALKKRLVPASAVLALDLIFFVLVRGKVRSLFLEPYGEKISSVGTLTQYGVMILFFVSLAAGLGLVFWMLRKTWKELKSGS